MHLYDSNWKACRIRLTGQLTAKLCTPHCAVPFALQGEYLRLLECSLRRVRPTLLRSMCSDRSDFSGTCLRSRLCDLSIRVLRMQYFDLAYMSNTSHGQSNIRDWACWREALTSPKLFSCPRTFVVDRPKSSAGLPKLVVGSKSSLLFPTFP